ncbi:Hypothetical protein R9X50_00100800 [Acrodontium crateriforme]|uniref:MFS general substrate transporter n=1 Tax=Acrodontium crateriforme TaxID=150365 RepID=A0AAQ3LZ98_9PEZI|nr:Hypothetical protein R9X50_00100800 [Acrodontium crateriforme]
MATIYEDQSEDDPALPEVENEKHWIEKVEVQKMSLQSILMMTCALGGIQVVWSTIFSNGTIYLGALGLPQALTALSWAMPAICGCFVQPLIGASSDVSTHSWGKRKPYIVVGAFGVTLSILSLAWAGAMGRFSAELFVATGQEEAAKTITMLFAVLSICFLSVSVQPLQCGLRALILDLCPGDQQVQAQYWAARLTGTGQILGSVAGLVSYPTPDLGGETHTFRILAIAAVIAVNSTVAITLLGIQEQQQPMNRHHESRRFFKGNILRYLGTTFTDCPPLMLRVFFIQSLAWMGWFAFLFYNTSFVNTLYLTTTDVPDGELSGYVASIVSLVFSCFSFGASILLPGFVKRCEQLFDDRILTKPSTQLQTSTLMTLWSASLALSSTLMFMTFATTNFDATVVLMAINGLSWAVTNWVPFALIGKLRAVEEQDGRFKSACHGSIIGLHNVAISAPQILAAGIAGIILWVAQIAGTPYGTGWVLRAGGIAYLAAASVAFTFRST